MTPAAWTAEQLALVEAAVELEVAARRPDGSLRAATPIWVVCADGQVYVRTWHRRDAGWYGAALASHRARVHVPGLTAEVTVDDVSGAADLRAAVDAAYRGKYRQAAESMVTDTAAATTLRLAPAP